MFKANLLVFICACNFHSLKLAGWPRHRENWEIREFGCSFFQTGKTQSRTTEKENKNSQMQYITFIADIWSENNICTDRNSLFPPEWILRFLLVHKYPLKNGGVPFLHVFAWNGAVHTPATAKLRAVVSGSRSEWLYLLIEQRKRTYPYIVVVMTSSASSSPNYNDAAAILFASHNPWDWWYLLTG